MTSEGKEFKRIQKNSRANQEESMIPIIQELKATDQCLGRMPGRSVMDRSGTTQQHRFHWSHVPLGTAQSSFCHVWKGHSRLLFFWPLFCFPFHRHKWRREQKISMQGMPVVYEVKSAQAGIMRKTEESKMEWNTYSSCFRITPMSLFPPHPKQHHKSDSSWPCSETELLEAANITGHFLHLNILEPKQETFF